jgi:hypothetical protein
MSRSGTLASTCAAPGAGRDRARVGCRDSPAHTGPAQERTGIKVSEGSLASAGAFLQDRAARALLAVPRCAGRRGAREGGARGAAAARACGGGASLYAGAGLGQGRACIQDSRKARLRGAVTFSDSWNCCTKSSMLKCSCAVTMSCRARARAAHCAPASRRAGAHAAQVACSFGPIKLYRVAESKLLGPAVRKHPQAGAEHMGCLVRQHPAPPNKHRSARARPGRTGRRTPPQAAMGQGAGGAGHEPSSARPGRSWPGARPGRGPPPAGTARRTWP